MTREIKIRLENIASLLPSKSIIFAVVLLKLNKQFLYHMKHVKSPRTKLITKY